ncbi:MAG TPA: flavodoxin-dependent (E)-4-hydroxy-3-methylbut-2-enyl-diphosphate synthase [bacterium]
MPPLGVAAEIGSLAADGLLDAIVAPSSDPAAPITEYCRTLLQAARLRTYKTEYISCPSCGRTLFDLEETTARIKARTRHLKGVRIGIMGCIVNGPGEMADADFGYVGGAPGKVNLYKGQDCLVRGVPTAEAVERLVEVIQQHGAWVEP